MKKLIFVSSVGVYGSSDEQVTEETIPNPKTFYGISKLRGEEHVQRLSDKLDVIIIRSGNVYGFSESMRFDAVINKFAFEANFNKRITIHGNGKQHRSFIHVDTLSTALSQLIGSKVPHGTYNLAERDLSVLDIVDTFKTVVPELEFIFINQHLMLRQVKIETKSSIKQYLNLTDPLDFETEIREFLDHFSF